MSVTVLERMTLATRLWDYCKPTPEQIRAMVGQGAGMEASRRPLLGITEEEVLRIVELLVDRISGSTMKTLESAPYLLAEHLELEELRALVDLYDRFPGLIDKMNKVQGIIFQKWMPELTEVMNDVLDELDRERPEAAW